jgi:Holliday junction resolvase RusA-like endonuclease
MRKLTITLPIPMPTWNRILAMHPWERMKLRHLIHQFVLHSTTTASDSADIDGLSGKAALDGLVAAGILADDSPQQVAEVIHRQVKGEPERTEIVIEEI